MTARDGAVTRRDKHGNLLLSPLQQDGIRRDVLTLLAIDILVNLFVAYELAGLMLPGWHTISYYAHVNPVFDLVLVVGLLVAGPAASVWFWRHSHGPVYK